MRSGWDIARRALGAIAGVALTVSAAPSAAAQATPEAGLIPAIQVDGRGHGHGVGMAQDGALAMGKAGANAQQILTQFYPATTMGKASGHVRVPVWSGDGVELAFPEGADIRGEPARSGTAPSIRVAAGGTARFYRDGDGTRVKTNATTSSPGSTTSSSTAPTTTSTTRPTTTTTTTPPPTTPTTTPTTLLPAPSTDQAPNAPSPNAGSPSSTTTTTTATAANDSSAVPMFVGTITATPALGGRVGLGPRNRRYRGSMDVTPVAGGLRFVNQVPVETYLRGMGEVRNPKWPAAGLQAQAIAARTYALRAMSFGGELCDTQRCQVYIGSDAEYAAMDKAVSGTAGQVLMFGKSLASAVYSANAGGFTADREEGFGLTGASSYPYLRAAPYLTENRDEWSVTIALADVARRLNYAGELTAVNVLARGPSGRATSLNLIGTAGEKTVTGLEFDASLALRSTLFTVRVVMAEKVTSLKGGSVLQAPPEEAPALAAGPVVIPEPSPTAAIPVRIDHPLITQDPVGFASLVAAALWGAVVVSAFRWRRRAKTAIHNLLS